jgi:type I site-specific restriction endonuclease
MPEVLVNYLAYQDALRLQVQDGHQQVYDPVRRKFVALTPEEHVRQMVLQYLLTEKRYPQGRIRSEIGIEVNGMPRRCDIVVFDTALKPWLVVECKSPKIALTQAVAEQVARYNMTLQAPHLVVSNGLTTYCFAIDFENKSYNWKEHFPEWA